MQYVFSLRTATMLPRLTVQPHPYHRLEEDYYSKPKDDSKIPEAFKKKIKRLDETDCEFSQLTKEKFYDHIIYGICEFVCSLDPDQRPFLDGRHALYHYLTNPLKAAFNQYKLKGSVASCTPIPCETDIDLLDRFYSSFEDDRTEEFITGLAECIRYAMGEYDVAIAAFPSVAVDVQEHEIYQETFERKKRVTIRRSLKSRSLSFCMSDPRLTDPETTSPRARENHIIRIDFNYASKNLKPCHRQIINIGNCQTCMPVRDLHDILLNHCLTVIYGYPGKKVIDKFIERIIVFHNLVRIDPNIKLEERTKSLLNWTMELLQSEIRPDETILLIDETSRSFNYEQSVGFKHPTAVAEHKEPQRTLESKADQEHKPTQIQEASLKTEPTYDSEERTTVIEAHEEEAIFEQEVIDEIPPLPDQVTAETTIHQPVKPTLSEAVSIKPEDLTPLTVKATVQVTVASKLEDTPEISSLSAVRKLSPSISPTPSETSQISDSDLSFDVPEQESDKKQKKQKPAISKHQLKKQRQKQRKPGKRSDTKIKVKQTTLQKAPETKSIPSEDSTESQLLAEAETTSDTGQKSAMKTMAPESKSDPVQQDQEDTTTKTSEQEVASTATVKPKKMIQQAKEPQKLLELIDEASINVQSCRDNWSTLRPHEKKGLLTILQNVVLYIEELFTACEKGLSTKKPKKWKDRLQRLLEQSSLILRNITRLENDIRKGSAHHPEHEIRVEDINESHTKIKDFIGQIEKLVEPPMASIEKPETSKKTDSEKPTPTPTLDDDIQKIDVYLKNKEKKLKKIKPTQTTEINIDKTLSDIHRAPDEIKQLEEAYERIVKTKKGKFTERIGKISHLLCCAYKIHVSPDYDMTESCQNHLDRLETRAERNRTCSRLWLIYSKMEQLQSQYPQIIHHLSDIKKQFTEDEFKRACETLYNLTEEACQLEITDIEKTANILQKSFENYISIIKEKIESDIESIIFLAGLLHQIMETLTDTTLHFSDWHLVLYQQHLSYIADLKHYSRVCLHNHYITPYCDQTISILEKIAEKIGTENLSIILNKTCEILYRDGCILYTSQIITWQLNQKTKDPKIIISLLKNTQELYVKLKWDQTKPGTQFMEDQKEPCEVMLMRAETKFALGNAMEKFIAREKHFTKEKDLPFSEEILTLRTDQSSLDFWMQSLNQFKPDAHITQITNCLLALKNQELELKRVFDFSESLITEELSAQSIHEILKKLAIEKTITLLHDTYCKIKPAALLEQDYRVPSIEVASMLVSHSAVLHDIGEQISPFLGQDKVRLHTAITAYKQALFMELFYYKIFKKHLSEQFAEFYKSTHIPQPNPSRVLSVWHTLSRTLLELDRIGADSCVENCRLVEDTFKDYHDELFQLANQQRGFINENIEFLQHRARCLCIAGHDQASLSVSNILLSVLPRRPDGARSLEGHPNPLPPGFLDRQFDQCIRYTRKLLQAVQELHVNALESARVLVEFTKEFTETIKAHEVLTKSSSCPVRLQAQTVAVCKELEDTRNLCLEYEPYLEELEKTQQYFHTAHSTIMKIFPTDIADMTINIQLLSVDDVLDMTEQSVDTLDIFDDAFTAITNIKSQQPTHPLPLKIMHDDLLTLSKYIQDLHKNYTFLHEQLCQTFQYTASKEDSGEHIVHLTGLIFGLGEQSHNLLDAISKIPESTTDIRLNHKMPLRECYYNISTFSNTAEWLINLLNMPSEISKEIQYSIAIEALEKHLKITKIIVKDTRISKASIQRLSRFLRDTMHIFTHQTADLFTACDALASYLTCFSSRKPFFDSEESCPTHEELKDICQSITKIIKEKQQKCQKKIPNQQELSYQQALHRSVKSFISSIEKCDSIAKDIEFAYSHLFSRLIPELSLQNLRIFEESLKRRISQYEEASRAQLRQLHGRLFSSELSSPDSTDR